MAFRNWDSNSGGTGFKTSLYCFLAGVVGACSFLLASIVSSTKWECDSSLGPVSRRCSFKEAQRAWGEGSVGKKSCSTNMRTNV